MIINGEKSIIMDNESFGGLFQNPVSMTSIHYNYLKEHFVGDVKYLYKYRQSNSATKDFLEFFKTLNNVDLSLVFVCFNTPVIVRCA